VLAPIVTGIGLLGAPDGLNNYPLFIGCIVCCGYYIEVGLKLLLDGSGI